jgi:hypothetical protein
VKTLSECSHCVMQPEAVDGLGAAERELPSNTPPLEEANSVAESAAERQSSAQKVILSPPTPRLLPALLGLVVAIICLMGRLLLLALFPLVIMAAIARALGAGGSRRGRRRRRRYWR